MTPDPTLIEQELLPCPFCGTKPSSRWWGCHEASDEGYWGIDCPNFCAQAHEDDKETAVTRWNTRTLQGSAALPSEAQIEAGADCLRQAGTRGLNAEEAAVEVYTAMRATTPTAPNDRSRYDSVDVGRYRGIDATPTAPVRDDEWLWNRAAKAEAYLSECERRGFQTPRLSPTPETGLVEALMEARQFVVIQGPGDAFPDVLAMIDSALSNVLPDEEK